MDFEPFYCLLLVFMAALLCSQILVSNQIKSQQNPAKMMAQFLLTGCRALLQSELRLGFQRSGVGNLWLRAGSKCRIHFQTDHQQRRHGTRVHHTDCECPHSPTICTLYVSGSRTGGQDPYKASQD